MARPPGWIPVPQSLSSASAFVTSDNLHHQLELRNLTANDARLVINFVLRWSDAVADVANNPVAVADAIAKLQRRPEIAPLVAEARRAAAEFDRLCAKQRAERAVFAADPGAARALQPGLSAFQRSQLVMARRTRIEVAARNLCVRLELRRDRRASASQRCVTVSVARRPRDRRSHRVVRVAKPPNGGDSDGEEPPRPRARGPPPRA